MEESIIESGKARVRAGVAQLKEKGDAAWNRLRDQLLTLTGGLPERAQAQLIRQMTLRMTDEATMVAAQPSLAADWPGTPAGPGDPPPDAPVHPLDGPPRLLSSMLSASRPTILAFGSLTCPIWRANQPKLAALRAAVGDRADTLIVYTREAHTDDGWQVGQNREDGLTCEQPTTLEQRMTLARAYQRRFAADLAGWSIVVDGIDDALCRAYATIPIRLYIVDDRVRYRGGIGPIFFATQACAAALDEGWPPS